MHLSEIVNLAVAVVLWAPLSVLLTQLIKRVTWSDGAKAAVAVACAAVVGVAGSWVSGDLLGLTTTWGALTATDLIAYAGIVYASASLWYQTYFGAKDFMARLAMWPA